MTNSRPAAQQAADWHEHGERTTPAALTVSRLRPHLSALGITRLARQTDLDRIGIPCFSAIRPAGLTLSVSQGKGHDDAGAMASALMEAAEFAIAEQPLSNVRRASADELLQHNEAIFSPRRLLPPKAFLSDVPIGWVGGKSWPSGERIWMPADAVTIGTDPADLPAISRSTNGLASGNTPEEALFHAICELVERDATSLWSLKDDAGKQASEFAVAGITDPAVQALCRRIEQAGFELRVFDQTTDLGVPCAMAVIIERTDGLARRFDIAAGYGCHPVGARAISRAITEAAQTRLTNIAGGRDDFMPAEYFEELDASTAFLDQQQLGDATPPEWLAYGTPLPDLLDQLAARIGSVAGVAWTELGGAAHGISVIKALSGVLEDRETNANWTPGKRALTALIR